MPATGIRRHFGPTLFDAGLSYLELRFWACPLAVLGVKLLQGLL